MKDILEMDFKDLTVGIDEAAKFLGFGNKEGLRAKAKRGEIPGSFKVGRKWMFLKHKLLEYVELYSEKSKEAAIDINRGKPWLSANLKIVPTIRRGSLSAELECKNRLDALQRERRKNMKTGEGRK